MIATMSPLLLTGTTSGAVSPEAAFICRESERSWEAFQQLNTLGCADLYADLEQLANECTHPDWDGEGAEPVHRGSIDQAARFLRTLPLGAGKPTIGAEPDGQVVLEWYSTPRRVLSVSMSPEGDLHYAALLGPERQYGTVPFLGDIPSTLIELIRRVNRQ